MQNLLSSRISRHNQSPTKLENLSPEKYGRAAYADLHYTPSKLAGNVLYRQVTTLKKYEDGTNKLREFEALNQFFKDRIKQIEEQRDGIQQSLTQQIIMYKKMLHEMESKHEARLKEIQRNFSLQIHKLIQQKEEQAKYAQSEKQLLEERIYQLQRELQNFRNQLGDTANVLEDLKNQHQKLKIIHQNICEKLQKTEEKLKLDNQKAKNEYQQLSRKLYNAEVDWQNKLENTINSKNKQIENIERIHRTQLEKIQNKRSNDNLIKNQQMKDLRTTFENQAKRLNQIVNMKDRMIDSLTKQNNKQKNSILQLTRNYENQINNLSHQKSRLLQEVEMVSKDNTNLNFAIKDLENSFAREKQNYQIFIRKLKDDLELNQINFTRQRDRTLYISNDLQRQLTRLRIQNDKIIGIKHENDMLCREIQSLRDLLLESSMQMERCKQEFLKMGCQKDQLLIKLRQLGFQNETLHRIKMDRQEEARNWKDTYFFNRIQK